MIVPACLFYLRRLLCAVVTTMVLLPFDCNSTVLRPFDDLLYDRRPTCVWAAVRPKINKLCGKPRNMPKPLYAARCSPAPAHTRLKPAAPSAPCVMNIHDRQAAAMA